LYFLGKRSLKNLKNKIVTKKKIYVAGPLFSSHERGFLEEIVKTLSEKLSIDSIKDIFLPHRDAGEVDAHRKNRGFIFDEDIKRLDEADIIIALLDGPDVDSGTSIELGYAYAREKEIFGILTDFRKWDEKESVKEINLMVWGVCLRGLRIYKGVNNELILNLKKALK
jgi:nucleoside 2-deoxyribosyltransferase